MIDVVFFFFSPHTAPFNNELEINVEWIAQSILRYSYSQLQTHMSTPGQYWGGGGLQYLGWEGHGFNHQPTPYALRPEHQLL